MHIKEEVRNILLIGSAGKGKSTLANVLTETNEFDENTNRIRGTEELKSEEFGYEGIKYRIIDTVGFGDSTKSTGEILSKLEKKADIISEGLNQILFVTSGRFTKEEVEAFNLLSKAIFDDQVTDYTTIVCTNFHDFEDYETCERDRKIFREETVKFSEQLAHPVIIYIDNPPAKGRYLSIYRESREESRKILLTHLKTCQEVYRPELLAEFSKMVDEFNLIIEDINKATIIVDFYLNNCINYLKEVIIEREKIVEMIEERKENVKEQMKQRCFLNTLGHAAILSGKALAVAGLWFPPAFVPGVILSTGGWFGVASSDSVSIIKENEAYQIFEKCLVNDKEKSEMLEISQIELKDAVGKFKEINSRFENSEYRKHDIDREKIEVAKDVLNKIWGEEIKSDINLKTDAKIKHSTGLKAVRAAVEAFCKLVPSPLSFYCIYRDHKEVESRTSVEDMEKAIKNWKEGLKAFKEKEQLLNLEYEKITSCKEEISNLLLPLIEIPNPA
ncbi:GTPase imap family member 7-like [Gigaspora margarita]|uniref:GTPase imap family member 7-like n=1 Tax=Gigaspora margarita TaxID=4874 RepID=A0A8H4A2V7_GIGMA|nr:GTPase imap family member 7-like [Gigaspora margarita]